MDGATNTTNIHTTTTPRHNTQQLTNNNTQTQTYVCRQVLDGNGSHGHELLRSAGRQTKQTIRREAELDV